MELLPVLHSQASGGQMGSCGGCQGPGHQPIPSEVRPRGSPGHLGQAFDRCSHSGAGQARGAPCPPWALPAVMAENKVSGARPALSHTDVTMEQEALLKLGHVRKTRDYFLWIYGGVGGA